MNAKQVLIISNLLTIAVTAVTVLMGLQYNHHQMLLEEHEHFEHRDLQNADCCSCETGLPIDNTPPTPPPFVCFPRDATVQLVSGEHVSVGSVEIGTLVHVGNNQYEPIYSFGHYDTTDRVAHGYTKLTTASSQNLILSPQHMVWTCNHGSFVPASNVKVGDELLLSSGDNNVCSPVTDIQTDLSLPGRLAPFTPSGTIVVNGILASSFVALDDGDAYPYPHWVAHAFEFPHRLVCHYLGSCPDEVYTDEGLSTWVAQPLVWSRWIFCTLQQQPLVWSILFYAFLMTLTVILHVVEFVGFQHPMLAMVAAGTYYYYYHQQARKMI